MKLQQSTPVEHQRLFRRNFDSSSSILSCFELGARTEQTDGQVQNKETKPQQRKSRKHGMHCMTTSRLCYWRVCFDSVEHRPTNLAVSHG